MSVDSDTTPPPALDDATRARVAELRARGAPWRAAAQDVAWDPNDLVRAARADARFPEELELARRELFDAAQAETVLRLRALLCNDQPQIALDAAKSIADMTGKKEERDTRLQLERLRCSTRLEVEHLRARTRGRKPAGEPEPEPEPEPQYEPEPPLTEEQRVEEERDFWRRQTAHVKRGTFEWVELYLWGGQHAIGGVPPDATDARVVVIADGTIEGRPLYWAVRYPGPLDAGGAGSVPEVPACPPEVLARRDRTSRADYFAGTSWGPAATSAWTAPDPAPP